MREYRQTFIKVLSGMLQRPMWGMLLISLCVMSLVYANRTVWNLPVAVVDMDHSPASRLFIRDLDATSKIDMINYASLEGARRDLGWRKVFAVIVMPVDLEKKMLAGQSVAIPVFGDATNRLANGQIEQDIIGAYQQMVTHYNSAILMNNGFTRPEAQVLLTPIRAITQPLFNPGISFAAIVFPGLLVMLLQHSLLIASVRVNLTISASGQPSLSVILGAYSALIPIWLFLSVVLFGLWPWVLGYRQTASIPEILLLTFPFLLAVISLGNLLTECIRRVEIVYLTLSFITMPVFYISGTIWPVQAMPWGVRFISDLLPSTWAIKAIAGVNQMGLPWKNALPYIMVLLLLCLLFNVLEFLINIFRNRQRRETFLKYLGYRG
ncbi:MULTISPECIES: ABC transporter permease [Tatumella]|uniref:ABC transporter permease n=1 Tax=Tatumella punctata TaxID=399969 RepID=A0ABW1VPW0_9GAMM|nr:MULTISPECIES: ABC transporter permease [unclassified Tatumella]MBS0877704.1 ABC transporter permease [Tatumella sp. JGM82]MBS0891409.1 ABC transporter permease [Tatumella sp. JGM94]MBS0892425.1 ABC transporter permease [Tatumella sp. JGM130]MBS0902237.1 ABC transporter permease [Tatumella sp. JGM100]